MNMLATDGYMHYQASTLCSLEDKGLLFDEVSALEKDPYAPGSTIRHRRYANAIILPWKNNELHWLPTKMQGGKALSGYDQGSNNPEHDSMRYFNAISPQLKSTSFLNDIVIEDFLHTFGLNDNYLPVYVGVHIVKVMCKDNALPGFSSPDCFHQDGEPFTFAHLISRSENAIGGRNYIASTACRNKNLHDIAKEDIISEFTLNEFMESFAVCDEKVSHYVDHLSMKDSTSPVERAMILIDYSLTKQVI